MIVCYLINALLFFIFSLIPENYGNDDNCMSLRIFSLINGIAYFVFFCFHLIYILVAQLSLYYDCFKFWIPLNNIYIILNYGTLLALALLTIMLNIIYNLDEYCYNLGEFVLVYLCVAYIIIIIIAGIIANQLINIFNKQQNS